MLVAGRCVRHQLLSANRILGKTARRQHHALVRDHVDHAIRAIDAGADHDPIVIAKEAANGGGCPDRHALVEGGSCEARNQGVAVHQPDRPTVEEHIAQELQEQLADIEG